jgi:hypothetical protein
MHVIAFYAITNGKMDTNAEDAVVLNQLPDERNFIRDAVLACMMNRALRILYFTN